MNVSVCKGTETEEEREEQPRCRENGSGADSFSKASQSFAAGAAKERPIIFFGDMRVEENTSRPANVRAVRLERTARAMQSGRKPLCQKVILFDKGVCGLTASHALTVGDG